MFCPPSQPQVIFAPEISRPDAGHYHTSESTHFQHHNYSYKHNDNEELEEPLRKKRRCVSGHDQWLEVETRYEALPEHVTPLDRH
jgi:hypothetical protein